MKHESLTHTIIGLAMQIHRTLGPGFLESIYHKAMIHECGKAGLRFENEYPIDVHYDGILLGHFMADLFVEDCVMVELKAVSMILPIHEVQLVNYLNATRVDTGLLINFGGPSLEFQRKRRRRT